MLLSGEKIPSASEKMAFDAEKTVSDNEKMLISVK
jgi:hypothetical protein